MNHTFTPSFYLPLYLHCKAFGFLLVLGKLDSRGKIIVYLNHCSVRVLHQHIILNVRPIILV